jgi:molecular chaperone DnaK
MAQVFLKQYRQDATQDAQMYERLKTTAEEIKIALSSAEMHSVTLRDFAPGAGGTTLSFTFSMSRKDLDALMTPLIDRTFKVTQDALALARLSPTSFDKVILVGGSTRTPLVRQRVEAFFGRAPMDRVNPDEVVAIGAAIQAAALTEGMKRRSIPVPPVPMRPTQSSQEVTREVDPAAMQPAFGSRPPEFGFASSAAPGGHLGFASTVASSPGGVAARPPAQSHPGTLPTPREPASFPDLKAPTPFEWVPSIATPAVGPPPAGPPAIATPAVGPPPAAAQGQQPPSGAEPTWRGSTPFGVVPDVSLVSTSGITSPGPQTVPVGPGGFGHVPELAMIDPPDPSDAITRAGGESPIGDTLAFSTDPAAALIDRADLPADDTIPRAPAVKPTTQRMMQGPPIAKRPEQTGQRTQVLAAMQMPGTAGPAARPGAPGPAGPPAHGPAGHHPLGQTARLQRAPDPGRQTPVGPPPIPRAPQTEPLPVATRQAPPPLPPLQSPAGSAPRNSPVPLVPTHFGHAGPGAPPMQGTPQSASRMPAGPTQFGHAGPAAPPGFGSQPPPAFGAPAQPASYATPVAPPVGAYATPAAPPAAYGPPIGVPRGAGGQPDAPMARGPMDSQAPGQRAPMPSQAHGQRAPMASQPPIFGVFGSAPPQATTPSRPPVPLAPPVLVDVTPRALIVETAGGYTDTIIPRNSKIPCERTRRFATGRDQQTVVRVRVAQGENTAFAQNTYLGEVELSGLRAARRGEVTVAVTFEVDADGILRVRARDVQTGQEAHATLQLIGVADESAVQSMINRFASQPVVGSGS